MNKLFSFLGIGFVFGAIKARMGLETLTGVFRGEDGFLMMLGLCGVVLFIAGMTLVIGSRKKAV